MGIREQMAATKERRYLHAFVEPIGEVAFRSMTERERAKLRYLSWTDIKGKTDEEIEQAEQEQIAKTNCRLVQYCLCKPDTHERVYGDDPEFADEIAEMDSRVIGQMCALIDMHCGFKEIDEEDLRATVKNLEGTHDDTSRTLSLESVAG
jgi:hypothetical protein